MLKRLLRNRQGQGLVEYALIIAGVALIAVVAVTLFGHKVTHLYAATAAVLPGAHTDDNNPIFVGQLVPTTADSGVIRLDIGAISAASGTPRLGNSVFGDDPTGGFGGLVVEANR